MVFFGYGASGQDPDISPEPERFDIRRGHLKQHLGFGHGTHYPPPVPIISLSLSGYRELHLRFSASS